MRYPPMPSYFFINNRKKIALHAGEVVIFTSNDPLPSNADGGAGFYQNSNFFYFSGIDQEDSYLIINSFAKKDSEREVLFIRETSEKIKVWEGEKLSKTQATLLSGIENVKWSSEFWKYLEQISKDIKVIGIHHDSLQGKNTAYRSRERYMHTLLKRRFPHIKHKDLTLGLDNLRQIKENIEIDYIKKAIEITGIAWKNVIKSLKPGMFEYELEAILVHQFIKSGCKGHAFEPIVAGGGNACVLHYVQNNKVLKDGDLVLMDFGADYGNYKADITRVLPINGKFNDRQTEIYESVLEILKTIKKSMVIGNTITELKKETQYLTGKALVNLGIIEANTLRKNNKLILKYFPHGVSHHLGLDVHDVGDRNNPLEANMILTCEPGIYIEEERIGIRLENDILIHHNGPIDLMDGIPLEIKEIEQRMQ